MVARLFTRRPGWHRLSSLSYQEIPDTGQVCRHLSDMNLLATYDGAPDLRPEITPCLRAEECRALLREAGIHPQGRVADLQTTVASSIPGSRLTDLDTFVRLTDRDLYRRIMLLFFANRRQDLSDFVIRDIGNLRYQPVELSTLRLFNHREDALRCLTWADWRDTVLMTRDAGDTTTLTPAAQQALDLLESNPGAECSEQGRDLLVRPLATLAREAATLAERERRHPDAITIYHRMLACHLPADYRHHAVHRLVIDLEKTGDTTQALSVTRQALETVTNPALRHDLLRRRIRLEKRLARQTDTTDIPRLLKPREVRFEASRITTPIGARNRFAINDEHIAFVEMTALQCYHDTFGYDGAHVENALPAALMAMLFWDIIFMPLPGAFLHEFQTGPLDWGGGTFYQRRETAIRSRLETIRNNRHLELALQNLEEKQGIANPLFSWNMISAETIRRTLFAWPGRALAPCLEALTRDTTGWGRGFPDLVLFDTGGSMRLSEVKGPGDSVSDAQRLWFDLLLRHHVPVDLCHIATPGEEAPP
jgi:hypothetical protein